MKASSALVLVIAIYVALDLSLPAMPGAFVFDPEDSVESAQLSRDHRDVGGARPLAPLREWIAVVHTRAAVPHRVVPPRTIRWSPRRAPAATATIAVPASVSEEPH